MNISTELGIQIWEKGKLLSPLESKKKKIEIEAKIDVIYVSYEQNVRLQ